MSSAPARLVETHSAIVTFVGDRAYKLKKPVDLGFLDFSTREAREEACHREVDLNRRLAPDVYLGVADVEGPDGTPCDHLVVMRRMPDERRLTACVERGDDDLAAALHQVARTMAGLHGHHPVGPDDDELGSRDRLAELWEAGFAQLAEDPHGVDPQVEGRIEHLVRRYLEGRAPLFDARVAAGYLRDGHGDLQADDIFLLDDGPRILDCLDFDRRLRIGDVLGDVAFLAMDLERLGRPDLAGRFLRDYRNLAGATWPPSLAHHLIAYRAHIRAKVGVIATGQHGHPTASVDQLLALCLRHLEAGRVRLTLIGGLPGTGKSTVAAALADEVDAIVLRTDEVRHDIVRPPDQQYAPEAVDATYRRMIGEARSLLERGEQVVLDASWADAGHRALAAAMAESVDADLVELRCVAPEALCRQRITDRLAAGSDPSQATPAVARAMAERFAPWPQATDLDTSTKPATSASLAAEAWAGPGDSGPTTLGRGPSTSDHGSASTSLPTDRRGAAP